MEQNFEKKKNGIKFNAFDFLIILIIIGIVALAVWQKEIKHFIDNKEYADIHYSFTVKNIRNGRENHLVANAGLTEADSGVSMGTIISVDPAKNSEYDFVLVDGSVEKAELKDEKDVRCEAKMKAVKKGNGYFNENGTMIVPGKTLKIETAKAVFEIRIESVSDL